MWYQFFSYIISGLRFYELFQPVYVDAGNFSAFFTV